MGISTRTRIVFNVIVIAALVGGVCAVCARFVHLGNVEFTDNAQVRQLVTPVNSRVQGFVKKVLFEEDTALRGLVRTGVLLIGGGLRAQLGIFVGRVRSERFRQNPRNV